MPFVEKHREAFSGLAQMLGYDCLAACRKAGIDPDLVLIESALSRCSTPAPCQSRAEPEPDMRRSKMALRVRSKAAIGTRAGQ